jgi:GNAT superfamily N-acetyltransferase
MIFIRRAYEVDAAPIARLVDALLSELSGSSSRYDERLASASRLLSLHDRVFGFVAFELQQPVGVIILSENASIYAGGMFGVITELYVVPAQRSAGVATKLVDAAATFGRERSWGRIEVGALERSLKFYLSAGFVELGPRLHLLL